MFFNICMLFNPDDNAKHVLSLNSLEVSEQNIPIRKQAKFHQSIEVFRLNLL